MILLLNKSHIDGYTRKDGSYVAPHEDKRNAAHDDPVGYKQHGADMLAKYGPGWISKASEEDKTEHERRRVAHNRAMDEAETAASKSVAKPNKKGGPKRQPTTSTDNPFGMWRGKSGYLWPAGDREPRILFHNSKTGGVFVVRDVTSDAPVDFGGVFVGPNAGMGGDYRHSVVLDPDKGLTHYGFNHDINYKDAIDVLRKDFPDGLSDEDADFLWDFISEDRSDVDSDVRHENDGADFDKLSGIMSGSNSMKRTDSDVGYALQRLRGLIAKGLGYQWVDMKDETGTSTLVLPGVELRPLQGGETFDQAESRIHDAWQSDLKARHASGPDSAMRKSHPIQQATTQSLAPGQQDPYDIASVHTPSLPMIVRRNPGEPSPEQAKSDRYKKPTLRWHGLEIAIENPAGSIRRGRDWETRMLYDYGYVKGSEGVDGDEVDVYVGPNPDAPMVYVVHQRKYGDWSSYDEDKVMLGFDSEGDACAAYLKHYDDPRFLGPVTAMPIAEFVAKVRATRGKPAMIKSRTVLLVLKAHNATNKQHRDLNHS